MAAMKKSNNYELDRDEIVRAVMGSVGRTVAEDFANFLDMSRFVSMEDLELVYTDPGKAPTLKSMEEKFKGQKASDITLRKISFLMTLAACKAGQILTQDQLKNLCKWLVIPENVDNKLLATFFSAFFESAHPYLKSQALSADELATKRKVDPDIDKKEETRRWFLQSPEFINVIRKYKDILDVDID